MPETSESAPPVRGVLARTWRRRASDCLVAVLIFLGVVFAAAELFKPGALYVGDYAVANVDTARQFLLSIAQPIVLTGRNGGYDFVPYQFRWAEASFYFFSYLFAGATGNSTSSKLVIVLYLALGGLGLNSLISSVRRLIQVPDNGLIPLATRFAFSVVYVVNPLTLQLVLKGYVGDLAMVGMLPWLLYCYDWFARSRTAVSFVTRGLAVGVVAFVGVNYTYSALMALALLFTYELSFNAFNPTRKSLIQSLTRLGYGLSMFLLLNLPTLVVLSTQSSSQYLQSSPAAYAGINQGVSIFSAISLTSGSEGSEYFVHSFPGFAAVFIALALLLLLADLYLFLLVRRNRWTVQAILLLTFSLAITSGPSLVWNSFLNSAAPLFPETFELLPLVAFSLFFLSGLVLVSPSRLVPRFLQSRLRPRRSTEVRIIVTLAFSFGLIVASCVPVGSALSTNLQPTTIPGYDTQAYTWLQSQPGPGRMLLVPPSYANAYSFNSGTYAGPTDYWTITPPRPIIIGDGGSMGGLEQMDATALYSGSASLLDRVLVSQGVQYVVLRSDVVRTWDVPGFRVLTPQYISQTFPFLSLVRSFGPISIFENSHYSGQFIAFSHPLIVNGNTSVLSNIAPMIPPDVPVVFTENASQQVLEQLVDQLSTPVLGTGSDTPSFCDGLNCSIIKLTLAENDTTNVLGPMPEPELTLIGSPNLTVTAYRVGSVVATIQDDFSSPESTDANWTNVGGTWSLSNSTYVSPEDSYQPAAFPLTIPSSSFSNVTSGIDIQSGFAAGILLSDSLDSVTNRSFQVWLIPGWNAVLTSQYNSSKGSDLQLVHAPINHNTTYTLTVTRAENSLAVYLDGVLVSESNINYTGKLFGGLISTTARAAFSNFSESIYEGQSVSPSVFVPSYRGKSWVSFENVSGSRIVTQSSGGLTYGYALSQENTNVTSSLAPLPLALNVTSTGSLSWSLSTSTSTPAFVASDLLDEPGWTISPFGNIVSSNGYAVGFVIRETATLDFESSYPTAVYVSSSILVVAAILIPIELIVLRKRQARPTRRLLVA